MLNYTLRTSSRARHVRLSVSHHSGLVIVVPVRFDVTRIPEIIAKKELWIRKALAKIQKRNPVDVLPVEIPTQIELQSIGSVFTVTVEVSLNRKNYLHEENDSIKLYIHSRNKKIAIALLKKWLRRKAQLIFIPWLEKLSGFQPSVPCLPDSYSTPSQQ